MDAFPSRPTHGARILRVFTNLHPSRPRVWATTVRFEALAIRLAEAAGLRRIAAFGSSPFEAPRRYLIRAGRIAGLPLVDRSPYDRFMLRFHDSLKENREFQERCEKVLLEFPPESTWIVFTDGTPHAALSGQYALEQTVMVPVNALLLPEMSPLRVLEGLCGRRLTG